MATRKSKAARGPRGIPGPPRARGERGERGEHGLSGARDKAVRREQCRLTAPGLLAAVNGRRLIVLTLVAVVPVVVQDAFARFLHAARSAIGDAARGVARGVLKPDSARPDRAFVLLGDVSKSFKGIAMTKGVYILSGALKRAIRDSKLPQIEIASRVAITHPRLSALLRNKRFGEHTKTLMTVLGATVGLHADQCARYGGTQREAE
jgi:hypothetical protein